MKNLRRIALVGILSTFLLAVAAPTASAHASAYTTDGKIRLVFGWVNEPATTDIPNRVLLRVLDNVTGAGLGGIDELEGFHLELKMGDEEKEIHIAPLRGAAIGNYSSTELITPSRAGIYELHVKGTINASVTDLDIAANEELTDIDETRWPAVEETDTGALQQRVATLEQEVATLKAKAQVASQTPATVTSQNPSATGNGSSPVPALGLLAVLGAVGVVVMLRRSK